MALERVLIENGPNKGQPDGKYRGVYKRGSKFIYVIKVKGPDGRWRQDWSKGFGSKTEALKARQAKLAEIDLGTYVPKAKVTVGDFMQKWVASLMNVTANTKFGYMKNIESYVVPSDLGKMEMQKVNVTDIEAFYAKLQESGGKNGKPLSPRTVEHVHATLRRGFEAARKANIVKVNPVIGAEKPAKDKRKWEPPWTPEQVGQFLAAVENHPLKAAFVVAARTGIRLEELCGLQWGDVRLKERRLFIRRTRTMVGREVVESVPKTEASTRNFIIDAATADALAELREELLTSGFDRVADSRYIFQTDDGSAVKPDVIPRAFKAVCARALPCPSCDAAAGAPCVTDEGYRTSNHVGRGLPPIRWHDLRHLAISLLLSNGVPPDVVSRRGGWSDVATMWRYYRHIFENEDAAAADAFEQAVYGQTRG